jgi:hypothetical protein
MCMQGYIVSAHNYFKRPDSGIQVLVQGIKATPEKVNIPCKRCFDYTLYTIKHAPMACMQLEEAIDEALNQVADEIAKYDDNKIKVCFKPSLYC